MDAVHVDRQALVLGEARDGLRCGRVGEIGAEGLDADAVPAAELGGEVGEPVGSAGNQEQVVVAGRQVTGEAGTDAGGRAGDECGAAGYAAAPGSGAPAVAVAALTGTWVARKASWWAMVVSK